MKYLITYSVTALYTAEVEAASVDEAQDKTKEMFCKADFGEGYNVEGKQITTEDEHGKPVYE